MKKIIALLLAVVMVLGLAACGGKTEPAATEAPAANNGEANAPAEEAVTIKVAALASAYMDKYPDMWKNIADAFTAETGIQVELITDKQLEDVIGPAFKAGEGPDFVHLALGRPAALTETFVKDEALTDLTDVLSMTIPGETGIVADKILGGFTESTTTNPYGDGKTYLAPMFYGPCGLFYNAGLMAEKGWEVPTTWDEMWELGDKAKEEGIALFCYPTPGYLQEFLFALFYSVGGPELFDAITNYEEGVWETEGGKQVLEIMAKLATYTEASVPANANNQDFTKNQQLILDNKAIFCPNGTWLPNEMKDAPRADGFEWGMTAIPGANGNAPYSLAWIEQCWVPASAAHPEEAKQFVAFLYSDKAAELFAECGAYQPVNGITDKVDPELAPFFAVYDNGAKAAMGNWAATDAVEGVSMGAALQEAFSSLVSGNLSAEDYTAGIVAATDALRAAKK